MNAHIQFILVSSQLSVSQVLIGEEIAIRVSGLSPQAEIQLHCNSGVTESKADFRSDENGIIDLSQHPPVRGSYSGIDSDGMFWSRTPFAGADQNVSVAPFTCKALINGEVIASAQLQKLISLPGILQKRLTLSKDGFEGSFATPSGVGSFPALIVLGGSEGGLDTFTAAYFASLGYATLSVAYHGMAELPAYINQIPLEYFKKSIEWLKNQESVDTKHVALMGTSRGAELALNLAVIYQEFNAVIAIEGSGVTWAGDYDPKTGKSASSWTFQGQDLPSLAFLNINPEKQILPDGREVLSYSNSFLEALENKPAAEAAIIPVEKIKAPILFLAGTDDKVWPSKELSEIAFKRREQHKVPYKDRLNIYKNAGHTIGIPGWPTMDSTFFHPVFKEFWTAGGTPAGNAKAQRQGWNSLLAFLNAELRK